MTCSREFYGIWIVLRDSNDVVQFAEDRFLIGSLTPHFTELVALKLGVERAISSDLTNWEIETNAINVYRAINNPSFFSMDEPLAAKIRALCSSAHSSQITHCSRSTNRVANALAQTCIRNAK